MPVTAAAAALAAAQIVSFQTSDRWMIAATYRAASPGRATIILAHGVAASRQEWEVFAARLAEKGVGTLAVDLRGHGGSTTGPKGRTDFVALDRAQGWPGAIEDLRAAATWLKTKGVPDEKIAFAGASIGANLASQAAAESPKAPFLLLMSPAGNYRGVALMGRRGLETLAAAAGTDPQALEAVRALSEKRAATPVYATRGHGVQMFDDPLILAKIFAWTSLQAGVDDELSIDVPWKKLPVTARITGPKRLTTLGKGRKQNRTGCGFTIHWGDRVNSTSPEGPINSDCSKAFEHIYRSTGTYTVKATIDHLDPADDSIEDWSSSVTLPITAR